MLRQVLASSGRARVRWDGGWRAGWRVRAWHALDAARARDTIDDERDGRLRRGESRLCLRLRRSRSRSRQPHLILGGGTCAGGVGHLCRPLRRLR